MQLPKVAQVLRFAQDESERVMTAERVMTVNELS
jgi:hypothetical protein